jgi:hypothetical protein
VAKKWRTLYEKMPAERRARVEALVAQDLEENDRKSQTLSRTARAVIMTGGECAECERGARR